MLVEDHLRPAAVKAGVLKEDDPHRFGFHRFHRKGNTSHEHHIPMGETDALSSLPMLTEQIRVRCDGCGEEHSYKPQEVMSAEIEVPETLRCPSIV